MKKMQPKNPSAENLFEARTREIGDPDTPEGRRQLAREVIGTCVVDGTTDEEEALAWYIAETYFAATPNFSGIFPDDESWDRIEAAVSWSRSIESDGGPNLPLLRHREPGPGTVLLRMRDAARVAGG
jgi:hypothetical protein